MSDLEARIREYLKDEQTDVTGAVLAVLDMHPHSDASWAHYRRRPMRQCATCGLCTAGTSWCTTVLTIARELHLPDVSADDHTGGAA